MTVQVPSIKFAEPKPLIGAAFHFSIPRAGAPQTWALAHFPFVFSIREEEKRGDRHWERGQANNQKAGGGAEEPGWGGGLRGPPTASQRPQDLSLRAHLNPGVSEVPDSGIAGALPPPRPPLAAPPPWGLRRRGVWQRRGSTPLPIGGVGGVLYGAPLLITLRWGGSWPAKPPLAKRCAAGLSFPDKCWRASRLLVTLQAAFPLQRLLNQAGAESHRLGGEEEGGAGCWLPLRSWWQGGGLT